MKLFIKFLFFIFLLFILNISFYYLSSNYRNFLQNLKYNDNNNELVNLNESNNIKDKINNGIKFESTLEDELEDIGYDSPHESYEVLKIDNNIDDNKDELDNETLKKEVILGNNYNKILNLFKQEYDLEKIEVNSKLFELTDEYPDYYYEYYSNKLTIYIFPTKMYSEIFDIFTYLQQDLPFEVKEINNFGEKSFYINLREDILDNYIRLVISKNGVNFGLKIKKEEYDNIKNILLKL